MDTKEKICYTYRRKKYEELTFLDDFMFCKVMRNPEICKGMLETILGIEIDRVEYPQTQKVIDILANAKSIRLDVYVKGEDDTIYNVEMQTTNSGNLPKRSRYYQGLIDMDLIEKGEQYDKLNRSYVIFICPFDPFGSELPIYKFNYRCTDQYSLALNDETYKVFVNLRGMTKMLTKGQRALFDYLNEKMITDEFTRLIESTVVSAKSNAEWRREFMTLDLKIQEECNKALEIGKIEGIEIGKTEGIEIGKTEGIEIGVSRKSREIFLKLLSSGTDMATARDIVGISPEEAAEFLETIN